WAALTEPGELGEWAPYTVDRSLGVPGKLTLNMIDGDTNQELPATVLRAEPPALLEHTFGTDLLRWELAATADGTRLTLRHTLQERDWLPKVAAGWHICLDVAEHLLNGEPVGPIRGKQALDFGWNALNEAYAARLDIPASGLPEGPAADDDV
ncbi:MAG: SRPBCC domain-containing protein, partial [Micromonosporaceae bacterium]|nr:SRPBCC domain-containing protein [Micromonosporaceae bacterium]